jgi:hypothetical protein
MFSLLAKRLGIRSSLRKLTTVWLEGMITELQLICSGSRSRSRSS